MAPSERSDARTARIAAWNSRATAILAIAAGDDASAAKHYAGLAATVVGMFDAGARDGEVEAFLTRAAVDFPKLRAMTGARFTTLAAELHRAAVRPVSDVGT